MNMQFARRLPVPQDVKAEFPCTKQMEKDRAAKLDEIKKVFLGESDKFILIIGPCSADRKDSVLEYIEKLAKVNDQVKDKLILIPRIYTNKPRTTGEGYKGMLHSPNPLTDPDPYKGILAIRDLHMECLRNYGFVSADEMLYPENHRYLSDLLGYVAVGARSVENQFHRLVASGVEIPVGMKNPMGGDMQTMLNAVSCAQNDHTFLYRGWEVKSTGNAFSHCILRGYVDPAGRSLPNYHYEDLQKLCEMYSKTKLFNQAVIVDCNHSNSGKKFAEQPRIAKDVLYSMRKSNDIKKLVKGLMIESYLVDGNQAISENAVFGQSITDPCLGWEKSEKLIYDIAEEL